MPAAGFDTTRVSRLIEMLPLTRRTRVVDVGANPINGTPPYGNLLAMGGCEVWGFEPEETAFARLTNSETETYLPYAVGDGSEAVLNVTRSISLSSLLTPDARTAAMFQRFSRPGTVERQVPVTTHRLDDLDDVPEFDLLKIDVQGGELQVYSGAARKLETAAAVISEVAFVPLYEDQPLLDAQMAHLRGHGMDFHKFLFTKGFSLRGGVGSLLEKRKHGNQLLDGDAVFIRSLRFPEAQTDEALGHLAVLADAVFESFDVAARCVQLLVDRGRITKRDAESYVRTLPDLAQSEKVRA
ncbi:MAG: FkbM family methyltransferase [Rhodobacteraceae bacterium]|nr:FkbM family methyltransferase [Alphaproteobacteria bacterium]NNK67254.1 FkbM family methyltransferase [Paracoccaceae bacterium]